MAEMRVTVRGMAGRKRVREVTARLRDIPGVRTVVADPTSQTVLLTGEMTEHEVIAVLAELSTGATSTFPPHRERDLT